jgi:hypothetical protein
MGTRESITDKTAVVRDLIRAVEVDLDLGVITDVVEDLRIIDQLTLAALDVAVQLARQAGHSWVEIGLALHCTPQGAQQRYGPRPTAAVDAAREVLAGQGVLYDD